MYEPVTCPAAALDVALALSPSMEAFKVAAWHALLPHTSAPSPHALLHALTGVCSNTHSRPPPTPPHTFGKQPAPPQAAALAALVPILCTNPAACAQLLGLSAEGQPQAEEGEQQLQAGVVLAALVSLLRDPSPEVGCCTLTVP